jgi:hypothetical protein
LTWLGLLQKRKGVVADDDANISFEDFRLKYLNSRDRSPHQRNIISLLEDGEPAWLHPNMIYEPGFKNYVLCNMPPEHAKSMTVSIDLCNVPDCDQPKCPNQVGLQDPADGQGVSLCGQAAPDSAAMD